MRERKKYGQEGARRKFTWYGLYVTYYFKHNLNSFVLKKGALINLRYYCHDRSIPALAVAVHLSETSLYYVLAL